MSLNDLKISRKLAIGFAAVTLTILAMGGAVLLALNSIEKLRVSNNASNAAIQTITAAQFALARQENSYRGYLISADGYYLERLSKHRESFQTSLDSMAAQHSDDAGTLALIDKARKGADAWYANVVEVGRKLAADPATRQQAVEMVGPSGSADTYIAPVEEAIEAMIDAERSELAASSQQQVAATTGANVALIGGMVVGSLFAIGLGWLLTRAIAAPVVAMTAAMRRLASGDNSIEVPAVGRKDEVGEMAAAVLTFKEAAIEKLRLEAEKARTAEEDRVTVEALGKGLAAMAGGDLTHRFTTDVPARAAELKANFNSAIQQLQDAMAVVVANVRSIRSGSSEISQAADDLSRRTEQQAASLEETAAALDQITATVNKTAAGARQASDVVQAARGDAHKSGEVVRDAVSAMSAIEQSAQQISQIIGVIDEIAFQTNLLALNAGVEAARAGDAGRGFAVVASEVRALAQRSAEAAKEIKTLISASTAQVSTGVSLVGQTGEALNRIVERVVEINGLVTEISASAQEQATGLQQVNTAVNQMDQVTQQNAAMVEESTAASHSLAQEADALAASVARFRIGDSAAETPVPVRPTQRPAARTVTAMRTTGGPGLSAALKPVAEEDGWEEF